MDVLARLLSQHPGIKLSQQALETTGPGGRTIASLNIPDPIKQLPRVLRHLPVHQARELGTTIKSLHDHYHLAEKKVEQLPDDAKVLILDFSDSPYTDKPKFHSPLLHLLRHVQMDGEPSSGSIFRKLLGFKKSDPRVTVWDVVNDPDAKETPVSDLGSYRYFMTTGSDYMIDEMEQLPWMQVARSVVRELTDHEVPGLVTCFGFQLFCNAFGGVIGQVPGKEEQMEFGHTNLSPTDLVQNIPLLDSVFDNSGSNPIVQGRDVYISTAHRDVVLEEPLFHGASIIFSNDYWRNKGMVFPLGGRTLEQALQDDRYVIGLQDHIEKTPIGQVLVLLALKEVFKDQGYDVDNMIVKDTPEVRRIFLNILDAIGRMAGKPV